MTMKRSIWIGFDPREAAAFAVARAEARKHAPGIPVSGIVLQRVRNAGLYWRRHEKRINANGAEQLWDVISDAPMATEFSISRFLVPHLARSGWALFMDCDMLPRGDLATLFAEIETKQADKALVCVQHNHRPPEGVKMDGQLQTIYARKNWSSFCFFNCDHPANASLTLTAINEWPGRDLHRFDWIDDDALIGDLPMSWNWLVGHSDPEIVPDNVHFTDGIPQMKGYENVAYADEWRDRLCDWALDGA